jgi:hypothetical protein
MPIENSIITGWSLEVLVPSALNSHSAGLLSVNMPMNIAATISA